MTPPGRLSRPPSPLRGEGSSRLFQNFPLQRPYHVDEPAPQLVHHRNKLVELDLSGQLRARPLRRHRRLRTSPTRERQIMRKQLLLQRGALALQARNLGLERGAL